MSAPHPHALSKFFTALLGKDVSFALERGDKASKAPLLLGEYRVEPHGGAWVISADLAMLALFAGALLGLSGDEATQRSLQTPMDEPVRDAIHEVLNIAASGIATTHRLVFQGMQRDAVYLSAQATDSLRDPIQTCRYDVKLDGAQVGRFTIYAC